MSWMLDYSDGSVAFEIHIPPGYGWFALGFSDRGDLFPADYCLLWEDLKGKLRLQVKNTKNSSLILTTYQFKDTWATDEGVLYLDKKQDCHNFQVRKRQDVIKYTFKRKFDTCDSKDYIIEVSILTTLWCFRNNTLTFNRMAQLMLCGPEGNIRCIE